MKILSCVLSNIREDHLVSECVCVCRCRVVTLSQAHAHTHHILSSTMVYRLENKNKAKQFSQGSLNIGLNIIRRLRSQLHEDKKHVQLTYRC